MVDDSLSNWVLLRLFPEPIAAFVVGYNYQRRHESLNKVTPPDIFFGRDKAILQQRETIKRRTRDARRLHLRQRAAKQTNQMSQALS